MTLAKAKQSGFSLIELVTVLLIITVLSTIAIRSTVDIGYSARYEQTRDRLESIRKAIIGDPKRSINGQPDISGFVADMGRLPDNLRELLQMGYCVTVGGSAPADLTGDLVPSACIGTNEWKWTDIPCTDGVSQLEMSCTGGHIWMGGKIDTLSKMKYGWNGPYLNVADNPDSTDAYTDGWGNEGTDDNYGWVLNFNTPNSGDLTIQSKGKDGISDAGLNCGENFDNDCNQIIKYADYMVNLSSGFSVRLLKPDSGNKIIVGKCSLNNYAQHLFYTSKESCTDAVGVWPSDDCSNSLYSTKNDCEIHGAIWYESGYGCEESDHNDKASCIAATKR